MIDKAPTSGFFALVAWSWFGIINEVLLRKHGLRLYYNAFVEGNHYGVDGLTNLALAAAERYGTDQLFTSEQAAGAIAAIGRVGLAGPLLDRTAFARSFASTAPLAVWHHILKQLRKAPEVLVGAFFIFLIAEAQNEKDLLRDEESTKVRASITDLVLSTRAVKRMEVFPKITKMAAGSVFKDQSREDGDFSGNIVAELIYDSVDQAQRRSIKSAS